MSRLILKPGALRLMLALIVVLAHYRWLESPLDGFAVAGFFVLSGYWIATLWDQKYSHCRRPLLTFYLSRAWRIYPLATIGTLLAYSVFGGTAAALIGDLFIIPGTRDLLPIDAPLWSLTVEARFYLLAPFLLFIVARPAWAAAAIFTASLTFCAMLAQGKFFGSLYAFPAWLFLFVAGAVYARMPRPKIAESLAIYSLVATVTVGAFSALEPIQSILMLGSMHALMLALIFVFVPYMAASVGSTSTRLDRALGDLAFPLYIIHVPLAAMIEATGLAGWKYVALATTAAAAVLLWAAVDRPLERLRRKFVERRYLGADAGSRAIQAAPTTATG